MPIYAYRCSTCGRAKDVLQKMSDPVLTECPFCAASTFVKQVTAAGFQLKGSGWYVTDFRGDSKAPKPGDGAKEDGPAKPESGGADAAAAPSAAASKSDASSASASPSPAAAPAAPASAPAAAPGGSAASGTK